MSKNKKCKECGCTENNSCVDKKGNPCYWATDVLCSQCRTFRFLKYKDGFRNPKEYFVKEEDLTTSEQGLLYHDLMNAWNDSPVQAKNMFIQHLARVMKKS